tara:strand:- start:274 stop:537 length:264 start_codon:yes stop_codon:yes gene_type:complete
MKTIKIIIFGKVQGVFFRDGVRKKALELRLKGYVKNVNETVEVVLEGNESSIKEMLEFCKKGPVGADVKEVEIKEFKGEFDDFGIEY